MKRIALFLVCLSLTLPSVADAIDSNAGRLSALKDIDDFLTELAEMEEAAAADPKDNGAELDDEGKRTYEELKAWAEKNPEEFARMLADDEATYGPVDEEAEEEGEEVAAESDDHGAYCPDPNNDIFSWEAKAKKKKRGGRGGRGGRGPRCTAAKLKTDISTCCLLFVRTKLGLPANPRSVHARDFGSVLGSHGYCTFKGGPDAAPVGAVLVYSGGESGHIERKIGPNKYWWGPTNDGPATEWTSTKRYLKNIWVKCKK